LTSKFENYLNKHFCNLPSLSFRVYYIICTYSQNEDWKENFYQNEQPPKKDNYSSPNKTSSPNTSPSPSTNKTPLSPQISPSKNKCELFEVLELQISASSIECKKAYKKLARNYHPDKWKSIKPFSKLEGMIQFQKISNAYEEICNLKNIF